MDLPQEPEELLRADVVGDLRLAFGSRLPRVGIALGALLEDGVLLRTSSSLQYRTGQYRTGQYRTGQATFARLVCSALGLVAATGGLAVAGALPAPVQHAVSGAADTIGFELPDGGFDLPFVAPPLTTAATPTTPGAPTHQGERSRSLQLEAVGPLLPDAHAAPTTTPAALPESSGATTTTTTDDDDADKPHITIGGVWAGVPSVPQTTPTTEPSSPPATPPSPSSSSTTSSTTTSTVPSDDSTTTTTAPTPSATPIADGIDP